MKVNFIGMGLKLNLETSMEIASKFGEEKKVLEQLERILKSAGCSEADGMDIKTATAEACLNAIEHGNKFSPEFGVAVWILVLNNTIHVKVYDHGKGAELRSIIEKTPPDIENFRGWGLKMISKLVDQWDYSYLYEKDLFCVQLFKNFSKG